ncbi:MAG: hypothetical protein GY757_46025 [bacterium]|nr:hypothetical protein [bacterium]
MGYSKQKTHIILNFFDWVISLPDAYKKQIKSVIKEAEEENKMEYVATWERDWLEEGIIKGETKSSNHSPGEINQVVISKHPRGDATPRRGCPTPHGGAAEGVLNLLSFGSQSSFYIRQRISPT